MSIVAALDAALLQGIREEVFPGAAAAVFHRDRIHYLGAAGDAQRVPSQVAMRVDACFDLASLTKVLATTAAAAVLVGRRELELDAPATHYWPELGRRGKDAVLIRHLMAHTSGLPAWKPLFLDVLSDGQGAPLFSETDCAARGPACHRGRALVLEAICDATLESPPGTRAVYSDLGFIALGRVLEIVAGERLDRFVAREVFATLGLSSLGYRPLDAPAAPAPLLVATGVFRPREPAPGQESIVPSPGSKVPATRPGEVDDDNAYAMGGVSGHAGLFGDARDVAAFGEAVLQELDGATRIAPPGTWHSFVRRDGTAGSSRALGFDTPSGERPAAGRLLAASRTIGHTGFTGTSLWIDLERRLCVALLTNRVHPSRANVRISDFRPMFHDLVARLMVEA